MSIEANRIDKAGTIHTSDVSRGLVACSWGYSPQLKMPPGHRGVRALDCGCRPAIHRFKCRACGEWVGWCMGTDDDDGVCDTCWAATPEETSDAT